MATVQLTTRVLRLRTMFGSSNGLGGSESAPSTKWWQWVPSTRRHAEVAHERMISSCKVPTTRQDIALPGSQVTISTVSAGTPDKSKPSPPLVLLHGFGAGSALWTRNLDRFCDTFDNVYAIDLPGFGLSSRIRAPSRKPEVVESWMIDVLDEWRREMGLNEIVLLGHSFGGYLAASYAMKYPQHVRKLILADPVGLPDQTVRTEGDKSARRKIPMKWRTFAFLIWDVFGGPFSTLRVLGPYGPRLLERIRPDIVRLFPTSQPVDVYNYIYHMNAHAKPTGEHAFYRMFGRFGWARRPLQLRLHALGENNVNTLFLYGEHSFMDSSAGQNAAQEIGGTFATLSRSGHHVYSDAIDEFHEHIHRFCSSAGEGEEIDIDIVDDVAGQ